MMQLWDAMESIPEYINAMEDLQEQSGRGGGKLHISDNVLAATANNSMIQKKAFPTTTSDYNKLKDSMRTWTKWKEMYLAAHEEEEREKRASNPDGNPFAGSAATSANQNNNNSQPGGGEYTPTDEMMDQLSGFLANLTAATTTSGDKMQQLIEANAALSANAAGAGTGETGTVALLTATNASLVKTNASNSRLITSLNQQLSKVRGSGGGTGGNDSGASIAFTIVKKKGQGDPTRWRVGIYCHSHGFGASHSSADCSCGKPGRFFSATHKVDATRTNQMGGNQDNKGWDSHLVGMPK
jgi:hypothetical protein